MENSTITNKHQAPCYIRQETSFTKLVPVYIGEQSTSPFFANLGAWSPLYSFSNHCSWGLCLFEQSKTSIYACLDKEYLVLLNAIWYGDNKTFPLLVLTFNSSVKYPVLTEQPNKSGVPLEAIFSILVHLIRCSVSFFNFFQRTDSRFFIYFILANVLQKYNKKSWKKNLHYGII